MGVERRPVVPGERGSLRLIHHAAYREVVERQFGPWDDEQQDRYFEAGWDDASHEAIEYNGVFEGYCAIESRDADVYSRACHRPSIPESRYRVSDLQRRHERG